MPRRLTILPLVLLTLLAGPALAGGDQVVLRTGTLDSYDRAAPLIYDQTIRLARDPALADREVGQVVLEADPDAPDSVLLRFDKGDASRRIGAFPQSVGNPLFMYFIETVIRDMAGFSGGSPFYIRNRMKDALVSNTSLTEGSTQWDGRDIAVTRARMRPFADDPNRDRMDGFQDLTIGVTMSDAVTGWYLALEATAAQGDNITYQRRLELRP